MNKDYFGIFMNCTLKHWSKVRVHCTGLPTTDWIYAIPTIII